MLFKVIESRDHRAVLESEDRKLKLTLEGPHTVQSGRAYGFVDCTPFEDDEQPPAIAAPTFVEVPLIGPDDKEIDLGGVTATDIVGGLPLAGEGDEQ